MNQTEWIIPCNPHSYNLQAALTNSDEVYWRQNARYEIGDIIYIYLSKGVSAIRYKAIVIGTDIEIKSEDDPYWIDKTMQSQKLQKVLLKRIKTFNTALLSYDLLKESGLKSTIQGPIKLKGSLRDYVNRIDQNQ
jgi:5-methylcytosine-specific restriction protein A